mmetsp:Transcript_35857/g.65119  ORF Transcript_35857/g.65119 Transcript_35857/m.65119 type:complete len:1223 (+) Transcript_35857:97-3765(+)
MGCTESKGKLFKDRLDQVQACLVNQTWRIRGDVKELERQVDELRDIHVFFSSNKDTAELARIQRLADVVTEELLSLLDRKTLRAGPEAAQGITKIAAKLDTFRATRASDIVLQKQKGMSLTLGKEELRIVESLLSGETSSEKLLEACNSVMRHLQQAKVYAAQVPELVSTMLNSLKALGERILEHFLASLESRPRDANGLVALAENLDTLSEHFAKLAGLSPGEKVAPLLKKVREDSSLALGAARMTELQASLANETSLAQDAMKLLNDIAALWTSPDAAQKTSLAGAFDSVGLKIQRSFEQAIASGDTGGMTSLLVTAKDFDERRQEVDGAGTNLISRDMERKKAGVTLNMLIVNAEANVEKQSVELRKLFREAEAKVSRLDKDKLDEPGEGANWKFKLGSGVFKAFPSDKNAEVEKLYQTWLRNGKPTDTAGRRFELRIEVRGAASRRSTRKKCPYGDKCYRKNPEHRREFWHPSDNMENASGLLPEEPLVAVEVREESYSLDFLLMTQVNMTRGGMRNINREEGMTVSQKLTHEYFDKVIEFVKEAEGTLTQAEIELHMLGANERANMQKQVDALTQAMTPTLREFLQLAVLLRDAKVMDEVIALLGVHAERLRLTDALKEVRLEDVIRELTQAYSKPSLRASPKRWDLLRLLCKRQKAGPRNLLKCRLALVKTKAELSVLMRRRVQMRCQSLLNEYEADKEFCEKFRRQAGQVLKEALLEEAKRLEPEAAKGLLKSAVAWQCDLDMLLETAGSLLESLARSAAASIQPASRIVEVLDFADGMAKAAQRPLESFCDLRPVLPDMAKKCFDSAIKPCVEDDAFSSRMPSVVKQVHEVRSRLRSEATSAGFDAELWKLFEPWYSRLRTEGKSDAQTAASEWAIAYCEQIKMPVPTWMMDRDQVEALRKLTAAVSGGNEKDLREAVVFAKLTDYKSDPALTQKYDEALTRLRALKRLPSGWEVTDLVGDDATKKMFKKADLDDPALKKLFQEIFDATKASIITRDRAARGSGVMPRGYQVEKIVSVMNAESWGAYLQRTDEISAQCARFAGSAPVSASVWSSWSGPVMTASQGNAILSAAHLPSLTESANEFLMFHGTKPEAADSIAANHFDMAFACKTGLFGAGLYFAESSSKSDEYCQGDARGRFPMILCRVALGRINYCPNVDPVKDPGRDKLEGSCIGGEYHSVLGDRKKARGTYREFVVYDHYQVYPQFIVWYSRVS